MEFVKNKKGSDSDNIEGQLTPSPLLLASMSFKQLCTSNINSSCFDSTRQLTFPEGANIPSKNEEIILLSPRTRIIYDHFISLIKSDTKSPEYFKTHTTNFCLPISFAEWRTLCKHLPIFEGDKKYDARFHLIMNALLTLRH